MVLFVFFSRGADSWVGGVWKALGTGVRQSHGLVLPVVCCVTISQFLSLTDPQFLHLSNGGGIYPFHRIALQTKAVRNAKMDLCKLEKLPHMWLSLLLPVPKR